MINTTMKNLTKLAAAAIVGVALFMGTNANAQSDSKLRFGIGAEVGVPTGSASDGSNIYAGITPRLQYGADEGLAWTLTSGFYNFFGKNYNVGNTTIKGSNLGVVPVKLGVKGFFADNFYFGAEAGAGFETAKNGTTKLIVSPGIGYANDKWDISARYENFSGKGDSYGLAGLRIAYGFGL